MPHHNYIRERSTPLTKQTQKLEYAFNSLLLVPQLFHFTRVKNSLDWLRRLQKKGISHEILGIWVTRTNIYLWVELRRIVQCCGTTVTQHCKIWCESTMNHLPGFDFCVRKIREHAEECP